MSEIKAIVVDDEQIARDGVALLLDRDPEIELVARCPNGVEAVEKIRELEPDLLFLDIQMPGMNGFEVLHALEQEKLPVTIFITAYEQYAIKAFEVNAIDYLLKPFDDDRFYQALEKAKENVRKNKNYEISSKMNDLLTYLEKGQKTSAEGKEEAYLTRLFVKNAGQISFIKVMDIDWIESDDYYVNIHVSGKSHLLRETMNNLEKRLDPAQFIRIHRGTIINIDRIKSIEPYHKNEYIVVTHSGQTFNLSRSRKELLNKKFGI